jgi:hypothetical protein
LFEDAPGKSPTAQRDGAGSPCAGSTRASVVAIGVSRRARSRADGTAARVEGYGDATFGMIVVRSFRS